MSDLKYKFTAKELEAKGFQLQIDHTEIYLQFLDTPEDYFGSKFIATQSVNVVEWFEKGNSIEFTVINPVGEEVGEPFFFEEDIDEYIRQARNGI